MKTIKKIEIGKLYEFEIPKEDLRIGSISFDRICQRFKDGRIGGHFLEDFIEGWFDELECMPKCNKSFDHVGDDDKIYECKSFTKSSGAKICPSSMVGSGRYYDSDKHKKIAKQLIYIIGDIRKFPKVRIKFIEGKKAFEKYGMQIKRSQSKEFFGK